MNSISSDNNTSRRANEHPSISVFDNWGDEKKLGEYVLVFVRRWPLFGLVLLISLVFGFVYGKTRPPQPFPHVTTLEIGRSGDGAPLETASVLKEKLVGAYISQVLTQHARDNGYEEERYKIEIETPKEANTITLKAYGGSQETETLLMLEQKIVDIILQDHAKEAAQIRRDLEQKKFRARLVLDDLKEQQRRFPHKYELIDETAKLLRKQIEAATDLITAAQKDRSTALVSGLAKGSIDQSLSTAILLIDNNVAQNQEKIRTLQERLNIDLERERDTLQAAEANNARTQKEQEQALAEIDFRINNIEETSLLLSPSRLLKPSLQGLFQVVGIFGLFGIVAGFFVVALTELVVNARKQAR